MSKSERATRDIYERLVEQGTSVEEIRAVYRKLRKAGYGEEAARERLEASLKQLREERVRSDRRVRPEPSIRPQAKRRMEDWFPEVSPRLRRQINKWAAREKLLVTGSRERWHDLLSYVKPSTPDLVNPKLLELLARRKHYMAENPYSYSLATTLDALYVVSRMFLGRTGGGRLAGRKPGALRESERSVSDALRRRDPFVYEYLSRFAHFDETLRQSLAYLELAADRRTDLKVSQLARVTRETWRLVVTTERVPRSKIDRSLDLAREILLAYGRVDAYGMNLDDATAIFQVCIENLQRFKLELYPVVLRAIGEFYDPLDESTDKMSRIHAFLGIAEDEILTIRRFYEEEARNQERRLAEQQLLELESIERQKEAGFRHRFQGVLEILAALFPDSGVETMDQHAYLVPYFDVRVFPQTLTFDHGMSSVETLSRFDPLQPILVLHRIVDNLLASIDHVRLEVLLERKGTAETFAEIKDEWASIYTSLFLPYLRALNEYARGLADEEYAQRFIQTSAARRLEEEINHARNRAIRNYGGTVTMRKSDATRLWSLVERLSLLLDELGGEIHQDIVRRNDPVSKRLYEELGETPIVDFMEHATPGTPSFKPVVRQLRRYIEAKHHSAISSVPRVGQLFLMDVLRGVTELYQDLTNDETSFVRSIGARILTAGDDERAAWARERNRSGDIDERLRIRLDEQLASEYTDTLTGLKTKNFLLQRLPAAVDKITQSGKPVSLLMMDIDHFKWINDELGHQKGDEVLRDAATTVLDGIRRGSDVGIRYGGEELLVIMPVPLNSAVALGERLRFAQADHVEHRDLYRPIGAIGRERAEPCGTFSVGVAQRGADESLDQCLERADKALYEAKKTRNAVCVSHRNPADGSGLERYEDYAMRMKKAQANEGAAR